MARTGCEEKGERGKETEVEAEELGGGGGSEGIDGKQGAKGCDDRCVCVCVCLRLCGRGEEERRGGGRALQVG